MHWRNKFRLLCSCVSTQACMVWMCHSDYSKHLFNDEQAYNKNKRIVIANVEETKMKRDREKKISFFHNENEENNT